MSIKHNLESTGILLHLEKNKTGGVQLVLRDKVNRKNVGINILDFKQIDGWMSIFTSVQDRLLSQKTEMERYYKEVNHSLFNLTRAVEDAENIEKWPDGDAVKVSPFPVIHLKDIERRVLHAELMMFGSERSKVEMIIIRNNL